MNIANFGFSGGETAARGKTGMVPASSGNMFGETLPFQLQLASSTAKLATVGGMAGSVEAVGPAFPAFEDLELSDMPESIPFAASEGLAADSASEDTSDTEDLAPTLALLAPIVGVESAPRSAGLGNSAIAIGADAANSIATANKTTPADNGANFADDGATAPVAIEATSEETLSDPDGDVAAMLRRAIGPGSDRSAMRAAPGSTAASTQIDPAQDPAAEVRRPVPDLARMRAAATAVADAATQSRTPEGTDASDAAVDRDGALRLAVPATSATRFDGGLRRTNDGASPRARAAGATDGLAIDRDGTEAGRDFDLAMAEPGTIEDAPLQRQVTGANMDARGGHATSFAAHHVAAAGADQASTDAATRSEATQTIPLDQRFSDRLGTMVGAAMGNATLKDGMLRLQVTPDHLGPIEIEMDTSGSTDRLQITVESEAVRQAVAQAHGRIEHELRQTGARLSSIDVALRDSGADTQSGAHGNAQTNSQADTDGRRPAPATHHDAASPTGEVAGHRPATRGGEGRNILYA